jgi:hypothetical protein
LDGQSPRAKSPARGEAERAAEEKRKAEICTTHNITKLAKAI